MYIAVCMYIYKYRFSVDGVYHFGTPASKMVYITHPPEKPIKIMCDFLVAVYIRIVSQVASSAGDWGGGGATIAGVADGCALSC